MTNPIKNENLEAEFQFRPVIYQTTFIYKLTRSGPQKQTPIKMERWSLTSMIVGELESHCDMAVNPHCLCINLHVIYMRMSVLLLTCVFNP